MNNTIIVAALNKKGTFATVKYSRDVKVKKSCPCKIVKTTVAHNVRIGAQYDALKAVQTAKGVDSTAEAHKLNSGLNGFEWVNYPTILKATKSGKEYVRLETNSNTKFSTVYTIDGEKVSKDSITEYLLASEKSSGEMPIVMNIGVDTIEYIH